MLFVKHPPPTLAATSHHPGGPSPHGLRILPRSPFLSRDLKKGVRFKTGAKISGAPTGRRKKLIFGGGAKPHRQKSIKERYLYDGRLAFAPKLKRTLKRGIRSSSAGFCAPYEAHCAKRLLRQRVATQPRTNALLALQGQCAGCNADFGQRPATKSQTWVRSKMGTTASSALTGHRRKWGCPNHHCKSETVTWALRYKSW